MRKYTAALLSTAICTLALVGCDIVQNNQYVYMNIGYQTGNSVEVTLYANGIQSETQSTFGLMYGKSSNPDGSEGEVLALSDQSEHSFIIESLNGGTYYFKPYLINNEKLTFGSAQPFDHFYPSIGSIGPGGGLVFESDGVGSGMEVLPIPIGSAPWGCYGTALNEASYDSGSGESNTQLIIDNCGTATAAYMADTCTSGGKDDWFLPAQGELQPIMSLHNSGTFSFPVGGYWSSSNDNTTYQDNMAHFYNLTVSGANNALQNKNTACYVLPVRKFSP